ncbi:MAG TPA: dipeptide epimerase [Gemmataceae bacterium]|nr:dipeptide epimerase [Gemmataceae bacterium]
MRITRLEAWPVRMRLSEPYTTACETVDATVNVFVRLYTDTSHVGLGCAAPDALVTGETPEDVLSALEQIAAPAVESLDPTRPAVVYERLRQVLGWRPSTLAALDIAGLDLFGKVCGQPAWKLLGGARESIPASMTIGILDEKQTVEQARRWVGQGFTFLKLKGGLDAEGDAVRARKVREVVGRGVRLALDVNGGYTPEQGKNFLANSADVGLEFLEQPTPKQHPDWLGELQRQGPLPIMADESLSTSEQALELAGRSLVRLFNVKLMKVGGIRPALAIDAIGEAAGIGVMIGCIDESSLSIAAGLHFALARPNVRYADLDAHFALIEDPAAGAVVCRNGVLFPGPEPGLGVVLD